jgi:hypothetical protein
VFGVEVMGELLCVVVDVGWVTGGNSYEAGNTDADRSRGGF